MYENKRLNISYSRQKLYIWHMACRQDAIQNEYIKPVINMLNKQ